MKLDVEALNVLFNFETPPRHFVRGDKVTMVCYGFGDASKYGFGSSWQSKLGIKYRIGIWGSDNNSKSSNYRELDNLVATLIKWTSQED